jgi:tetratricopeptide (TPR) repeat protein
VGDAGDQIRRLMAQGLDLYALGQVAEAIACWRRVLSLDPKHAEARDYLSAAGGEPDALARTAVPAAAPEAPAGSAMTAEAVRLLRAGKPGDALDLLESQTRAAPDDLDAQAYRELARAALLRVYRARTGSGERVPFVRIAPNEVLKYNLPAPAGFLLSMIDGTISIDELLSVSGMDPFDALRALHNLLDAGIVEARP